METYIAVNTREINFACGWWINLAYDFIQWKFWYGSCCIFGSYCSIVGGTRWRYKPEGRGFDSRWCHWNISLT